MFDILIKFNFLVRKKLKKFNPSWMFFGNIGNQIAQFMHGFSFLLILIAKIHTRTSHERANTKQQVCVNVWDEESSRLTRTNISSVDCRYNWLQSKGERRRKKNQGSASDQPTAIINTRSRSSSNIQMILGLYRYFYSSYRSCRSRRSFNFLRSLLMHGTIEYIFRACFQLNASWLDG